jgi:tRNA 5-methylaminomethyl-2-thiouridine biosynthesis bifunctional protein
MRVAIIGAGLAGTALAYVLKQAGAEPLIYEASGSIASGASGNDVGLYNPRFTAEQGPEQAFYSDAFFKAIEVFKALPDIDWNPCGALHLVPDEKKAKRFPKTVENWGWGENEMRMVSPQQASDIAGVEITKDCLYLPRSGIVSPRKLCVAYSQGVEVNLNTVIHDLSFIEADAIVLAAGMECLNFPEGMDLPLKAVRGQISYFRQTEVSSRLRCTLGYSGYIAPAIGGVHCIGSTFQRWLSHTEIIPQDDTDNLEKMMTNIPSLKGEYNLTDCRAAVRTTAHDHFPVIGKLTEGVFVSTAHGSHGILSSLMGAHIISNMILKNKEKTPDDVLAALNPYRQK